MIVARPATMPVTRPTSPLRPWRSHSIAIQVSVAVAAEMWVTIIAMPALPLAASALPALKPNQPTHSMAAPAMVMPGLCGGISSWGKPRRGPSTQREHERRDAGGRVHDDAAREIHHAEPGEPAAAPHPMSDRRIDDEEPKAAEQQHRAEVHALGKGADDQRRGDDREGHLEHEKDGLGHRRAGADGARPDIGEQCQVQAADPWLRLAAVAEGQAVAEDQPQHRHERSDDHAVAQHRQHVLGAHQTAIEQREAGQRHEQHQGRGGEQPRRVGAVGAGLRGLGAGRGE